MGKGYNHDCVSFQLIFSRDGLDLILAGKNSKADKKGLVYKIDQLDRDRLLRLRKATKTGEIVRTKNGVFETTSCSVCGLHHKVSLFLKHQLPCPGTRFGKLYYSTHKEEKILMESFPLETKLSNPLLKQQNKLLAKTCSDYKPRTHEADEGLKRRVKSAHAKQSDPGFAVREIESAILKEIGGVEGVAVKEDVDIVKVIEDAVFEGVTETMPGKQEETLFSAKFKDRSWNDVFSVSETSSDLGADVEGSEKDMVGMRRQLIREMYTQEEEALRLRLAQEQDKNHRDSR